MQPMSFKDLFKKKKDLTHQASVRKRGESHVSFDWMGCFLPALLAMLILLLLNPFGDFTRLSPSTGFLSFSILFIISKAGHSWRCRCPTEQTLSAGLL